MEDQPSVHVTATDPETGKVLGEWSTAEDGTHTPVTEQTPVTAETKEGDPNWVEAGDPRYAGFRITDMWALLIVDQVDDQETVAMIADPTYGTLPMLATDERRLESFLRPAYEDIQRGRPEMQARLVHFRVVDE